MGLSEDTDYSTSAVPLNERRGPFTMGLLWITMVTAFPSVLIGFQWFKDGLTLGQVISCTMLSCLILLAYSIPAAYLGSKSGQTYGLLSRRVFGRWGSRLVSCNLLWIFIAWYSLSALLLADGLIGIFHLPVPVMALAAGLAIVMAFNNFFGFSGVANFARYLAAPLLITMVGYTFCKAVFACPASAITAVPHTSFAAALTSVSGFVIGFAVWGNEPDYWRYGKPNKWLAAVPLTVALAIGQVVFPATGWMVARISGITDYGAATSFINTYSFGGIAAFAAIVLVAAYFACNDSNLYGMINATENLKALPHHAVCGVLALLCAAFSAWLSTAGIAKSLESIASLNCVFLPTVTVVMIVEFFLVSRIIGIEADFSKVAKVSALPALRWPGVTALIVGFVVGVSTSGVIPGTEALHVGICSVQAWIAAAVVYVPLRLLEHRLESSVGGPEPAFVREPIDCAPACATVVDHATSGSSLHHHHADVTMSANRT